MKIGLGTAQFGLNYGISNKSGKTSLPEVKEILKTASDNNVRIIDTAALYGESEKSLGLGFPEMNQFIIVTKTPAYDKNEIKEEDGILLRNTFFKSLANLGQKSVYGLLMHHADDLLAENGTLLWQALQEIKNEGFVEKIGVSAYSSHQIDRVLDRFDIGLIQIPLNIYDQRFLKDGYLVKLQRENIEIHARSLFLQGLLLMDPSTLPTYFEPFRGWHDRYWSMLKSQDIKPLNAALGFVLLSEGIDVAIVGVNHSGHLREILDGMNDLSALSRIDFSSFAVDDESITNPSFWRFQN
jgi:aryl-alcohol dehydrogenase-like predicted oxidoreductase